MFFTRLSSTAIRAKVLSETLANSSKIYTVRILKTYKGAAEIDQIAGTQVNSTGKRRKRVVTVTTSLSSASCGIRLDTSKVYLLLGYIEEHRLHSYSCKWHGLWKDVTLQQRRGLKTKYGRNCACRIEKYCFKRAPETCDGMVGGCDKPETGQMAYCKRKYSFCVKTGEKCKWIIPKRAVFRKCLNN
ncbi:Metalloproteinase inhibitor 3 [Desmophyllum pertusum]|uniref:Metalloproteinase inhibitor 3 n=1 Tax=Desmophyllum pertusum TaxID=174260 RepID=A0A9W9YS43_9CNID|nr:Metalloproteinase inhibitor 3 [Desmophyllum pertusum]